MLRLEDPRRQTPWGLWAGIALWAVLVTFVVLTLWNGHPPISLPAIPWAKILGFQR